jgi:hypothetical protein
MYDFSTRPFAMPHPLVTIGGLLFIVGLLVYGFMTRFSHPLPIIVVVTLFVLCFSVISNRSARRMRDRETAALQRKKSEPVLRLN